MIIPPFRVECGLQCFKAGPHAIPTPTSDLVQLSFGIQDYFLSEGGGRGGGGGGGGGREEVLAT